MKKDGFSSVLMWNRLLTRAPTKPDCRPQDLP